MFIFLSKFLPLLVYPLGMASLLLLAALILRRKERSRTVRLRTALTVTALLILLLGSNRWVSYALARSLEWRYLPPDPIPSAEVIVVLGGGTESAQYPRTSVEVNSAGDRILYAARLYQQGKAPKILVTGGNIEWLEGRSMTPAAEMADILQLTGVPEEDIWLQPRSQNTYEDALYTQQMLAEKGVQRVLLVTSAMHMPRSVGLFQAQGVDVIPAPADYTVTEAGWQSAFSPNLQSLLVNLLPNASSLALTTNVMKEYIGMFMYSLKGWM